MISLILAAVSLGLLAFAALLASAGISFVDDAIGTSVVLFAVALLAVYPAWLFARAAVRIRRMRGQIDASMRRYFVSYTAVATVGAFLVVFLWSRSVGLASIAAFAWLAAGGLRAARDFEPQRKRRPRRGIRRDGKVES